MVTSLSTVAELLEATLCHSEFRDSSLNGLQVEASSNPDVSRVAVAVDASLETVERAIREQTQLLIVHHGLFWDSPFALRGALARTVSLLFRNNVSLFASHLPLDAHPILGNNAGLCRLLDLAELAPAFPYQGKEIGWQGINAKGLSRDDIRLRLAKLPGADLDMLVLPFGPDRPKRLGIVSGSGADALYACAALGIDTLITGEPRQFAFHFAKENQLNAIFAGHYATETVGVQALGELLVSKFGLVSVFIDCPTGI